MVPSSWNVPGDFANQRRNWLLGFSPSGHVLSPSRWLVEFNAFVFGRRVSPVSKPIVTLLSQGLFSFVLGVESAVA